VKPRRSRSKNPPKRRTTLTLPSDVLLQAARIARARKVSLTTVVSEALSEGLRICMATERSEQVLSSYKKAFAGFTNEQILLLDGVLLEPVKAR
jgi:hypothetical protein